MKQKSAYSIRSLEHAYNGKTVLSIPQLEIAEGEVCAWVGPNGSGKSTLLHILSGLLKPLCGNVLLHGVETAGIQWRRQATLVHQKPVLFTTTVWKNIAYGLRASGLPAREIQIRVQSAIEQFGLAAVANRQARKLSGGEAQRVVLARGLVLETPILLLDEPTSFLDDAVRPILFERLRKDNQARGITILVATHDLKLVSSLATRIIRLDQGRIVEELGSNP
jgi:tungstate transport system ATP-binding protein